jgi:uncharacterized protein YbjT (DUF2867 family)
MLLILGATGHIGTELVSILSSKGIPAVAATRDLRRGKPLPGIRWARVDLADPASMREILQGIRGMFLLTGNGPDLASLQIGAIRAAKSAGVERVVKLSALGASDHSRSPIAKAHYEAEEELLATGLAWTILRPHVFMQNFLRQAPAILRDGRIRAASGDGRIPFIDTRDIAAVAAVTLTQPGHEGKKYVLTGPEALSYHDIARILSEVAGRPLEYVAESLDETRDRMVREGSPAWAIEGLLALAAYQRGGGPTAVVHDTVERVLGRRPRSFAEFAKDHAPIFQGTGQTDRA